MQMSRRGQRGASLVELLVVTAILGLAAAVATPAFLPLVRQGRLHAEAETVAGFLDSVRRLAMAQGRCVRVRHAGDELVAERRTSGDCTNLAADGWEGPVARLRTEPGVALRLAGQSTSAPAVAPVDDHRIVFRPSGRLWGDGDLEVRDDGARVLVAATGHREGRGVLVTSLGRVCVVPTAIPPAPLASPVECP